MKVDAEILNKIKITPLIDTLKLENIDDDIYFSNKYKNYISNSRLGVFKKYGVDAFFNGIPNEYNPSFVTGELVHQQVLQPEFFEVIEGVYKPTAKAGLMADALYKNDGTCVTDDEIKSESYKIGYYKDKLTENRLNEFRQKAEPYWRDRYLFEQSNPKSDKTRIYTDIKNYDILQNCLNSINNNSKFQELLHPQGIIDPVLSFNEHTILMDIEMSTEEYGTELYHLKAKLDNFTINSEENTITVNDLKTTSRPASIFNPEYFSYQREIAFYNFLLKLVAKEKFNMESPSIKGNFLVVSTVPEYDTLIYPMTPKLYKSGWNEAKYLLRCVYYFNKIKGYKFS